MRKGKVGGKACDKPDLQGRVLARALAEDLRHAHGGSGTGGRMLLNTNTATDLGDRLDFTFRGGDGDGF
jgi:hypothetical protein